MATDRRRKLWKSSRLSSAVLPLSDVPEDMCEEGERRGVASPGVGLSSSAVKDESFVMV